MLVVAAFVFVYYTAWALLQVRLSVVLSAASSSAYPQQRPSCSCQPFLPADSPLQPLFPAREWATRLPALVLVAGSAAVSAFIGSVMLKESRKRRERAQGKAA